MKRPLVPFAARLRPATYLLRYGRQRFPGTDSRRRRRHGYEAGRMRHESARRRRRIRALRWLLLALVALATTLAIDAIRKNRPAAQNISCAVSHAQSKVDLR